MRIGVVYRGTLEESWSESDAIALTLRGLGHDVTDLPQGRSTSVNWLERIQHLTKHDLVIFSGPEKLLNTTADPERRPAYQLPPEHFIQAVGMIKAPKFAMYQQTMFNPLFNFPFVEMLSMFDQNFYPTSQDAETLTRHGKDRVHWLPYGVDTKIFKRPVCQECGGAGGKKMRIMVTGPHGKGDGLELCSVCKGGKFEDVGTRIIPLGFMGIFTESESVFHHKLKEVWNTAPCLIGNSAVQDIEGPNFMMTAHRLAWNLARIMIFPSFPTLSAMIPARVYEAAACGCCVLMPKLEGPAAKNLKAWSPGKNIGLYKMDPKAMLEVIGALIEHPERAVEIGKQAAEDVARDFTLKARMETVLSHFSKPEEKAKAPSVIVLDGPVEEAKISLLHTTARADKWKVVADAWFESTDIKSRIEYVLVPEPKDFGVSLVGGSIGITAEGDIEKQIRFDHRFVRFNRGRSCLVDGFNHAAKLSTGDILVVIADDFFPIGKGWDTQLLQILRGRVHTEAAVWASTGGANDEHFIVHPILTRKYYERYGYLFNPVYESWFADNEFFEVAKQDGVIIDARESLHFDHRHWTEGKSDRDGIYQRQEARVKPTAEIFKQRQAEGFPRKNRKES